MASERAEVLFLSPEARKIIEKPFGDPCPPEDGKQ